MTKRDTQKMNFKLKVPEVQYGLTHGVPHYLVCGAAGCALPLSAKIVDKFRKKEF